MRILVTGGAEYIGSHTLGMFLEKSGFCVMGDVPNVPAESVWGYLFELWRREYGVTF
jgi:UDP-glucose 4-epimerase